MTRGDTHSRGSTTPVVINGFSCLWTIESTDYINTSSVTFRFCFFILSDINPTIGHDT